MNALTLAFVVVTVIPLLIVVTVVAAYSMGKDAIYNRLF
jgi:hypothetical protein